MTPKEWLNVKISHILPRESGPERQHYTQLEYIRHLNTKPKGVSETMHNLGVSGLDSWTPGCDIFFISVLFSDLLQQGDDRSWPGVEMRAPSARHPKFTLSTPSRLKGNPLGTPLCLQDVIMSRWISPSVVKAFMYYFAPRRAVTHNVNFSDPVECVFHRFI